MATKNKQPDMYIDGQQMNFHEWEISYDDPYNRDNKLFYKSRSSYIRFMLRDGTEVTFHPIVAESKDNTIYLYGLLESLFPNIARDYYLEDWQVAYLQYSANKQQLASQAIHRYTVNKTDDRFTTREAKAFKAGYDVRNKK